MRNASTVAVALTVLIAGFIPGTRRSEAIGTMAPYPAEDAVMAPPTTEPARHVSEAGYRVRTTSAELVELAHWARARYTEAGLVLPPVELRFHEGREQCGGNAGRAITRTDGYQLDVCSTKATNHTKKLVLHELAHAWVDVNLSSDQRQAFMELRNVSTWNDHDTDWWLRGTEHAADIVAWGLQETSRRPRLLPNNDLNSLTTAYQWLTGASPLCDTGHERQPGHAASPQPDPLLSATKTGTHGSAPQPHRLEP